MYTRDFTRKTQASMAHSANHLIIQNSLSRFMTENHWRSLISLSHPKNEKQYKFAWVDANEKHLIYIFEKISRFIAENLLSQSYIIKSSKKWKTLKIYMRGCHWETFDIWIFCFERFFLFLNVPLAYPAEVY